MQSDIDAIVWRIGGALSGEAGTLTPITISPDDEMWNAMYWFKTPPDPVYYLHRELVG